MPHIVMITEVRDLVEWGLMGQKKSERSLIAQEMEISIL